jgi:hypothetical protein
MSPEASSADVSPEKGLGLPAHLFLLGFIMFLIYAWRTHLSPEQLVDFIKALGWPVTTLIVASFFKKEITGLLNRITGAKIGGVELQTSQTTPPVEITTVVERDSPEENVEFERYNTELVTNTKAALFWFSNQKQPVTLPAFLQIHGLSNPVPPGTKLSEEKLAIFNALQLRELIESHGTNQFKISRKGERYLRFIGVG